MKISKIIIMNLSMVICVLIIGGQSVLAKIKMRDAVAGADFPCQKCNTIIMNVCGFISNLCMNYSGSQTDCQNAGACNGCENSTKSWFSMISSTDPADGARKKRSDWYGDPEETLIDCGKKITGGTCTWKSILAWNYCACDGGTMNEEVGACGNKVEYETCTP